jgi:hypothetical protein
MKKITLCLSAIVLSLTFNPLPSTAADINKNPTTVALTPAEKAKIDGILLRLNEIKDLDKTSLTSAERKTLRKEVRTLKHEMKETSRGVYLSVGAIIIIILLLILIL